MVDYHIETFNTDGAVPYANCIYRLSKVSGKHYRDITDQKLEKCKKDCIFFIGTDSINEKSDHILQFKGEAKKFIIKNANYNINLSAHNDFGFDSYVVLNVLSQ